DESPLHQLGEAAHFAGAVQDEPAARHALLENVLLIREDGGHAGAHRTAPAPQLTRAADDGRVSDEDALDVGDRVELARPESAERQSQLAGAKALFAHELRCSTGSLRERESRPRVV